MVSIRTVGGECQHALGPTYPFFPPSVEMATFPLKRRQSERRGNPVSWFHFFPIAFLCGAHQAPLSMEFSRQEYWSGLQCPPPGDLLDPLDPGITSSPGSDLREGFSGFLRAPISSTAKVKRITSDNGTRSDISQKVTQLPNCLFCVPWRKPKLKFSN